MLLVQELLAVQIRLEQVDEPFQMGDVDRSGSLGPSLYALAGTQQRVTEVRILALLSQRLCDRANDRAMPMREPGYPHSVRTDHLRQHLKMLSLDIVHGPDVGGGELEGEDDAVHGADMIVVVAPCLPRDEGKTLDGGLRLILQRAGLCRELVQHLRRQRPERRLSPDEAEGEQRGLLLPEFEQRLQGLDLLVVRLAFEGKLLERLQRGAVSFERPKKPV